jgi:CHASE3 domain sensor protein
VHTAAAHRPEIQDVADQEELLAIVAAQEVQQPLRLARRGPEVNVRQEDRAHVLCHGAAQYRARMTGS